jgi:sensor histidine kinase regulating citrate/malate metabolism
MKYKKPDGVLLISNSAYHDDEHNVQVLKYQDNGIGIDMERYGNEVFGLYKTFVNHPGAHDVGLFLIKTELESQKASTSAESQPGEGVTFTITFPS